MLLSSSYRGLKPSSGIAGPYKPSRKLSAGQGANKALIFRLVMFLNLDIHRQKILFSSRILWYNYSIQIKKNYDKIITLSQHSYSRATEKFWLHIIDWMILFIVMSGDLGKERGGAILGQN